MAFSLQFSKHFLGKKVGAIFKCIVWQSKCLPLNGKMLHFWFLFSLAVTGEKHVFSHVLSIFYKKAIPRCARRQEQFSRLKNHHPIVIVPFKIWRLKLLALYYHLLCDYWIIFVGLQYSGHVKIELNCWCGQERQCMGFKSSKHLIVRDAYFSSLIT